MVALNDYSVTYPRRFVARDGALTFTAAGSLFSVEGLPSANVVVYRQKADGTVELLSQVKVAKAGATYTATFRGLAEAATYYVSAVEALRSADGSRTGQPQPVSCAERRSGKIPDHRPSGFHQHGS